MYGLECINWTYKLSMTVETFQNHIMTFMTNHRLLDHIKIDELLSMTALVPIMSIIKSKTLKLYGHIKRSQSGLSKICLEGMISGMRSRGRQRKRWRDIVYELSGLNLSALNEVTQNRNLRRQLTHVSAQSAVIVNNDDFKLL